MSARDTYKLPRSLVFFTFWPKVSPTFTPYSFQSPHVGWCTETRINELATDLRKGRVDLPTSVLLNIRNREARRAFQDGTLNLGHFSENGRALGYEPKFYVMDGQHRILALKRPIEEFEEERWSKYQIPFTCMLGATEGEEMDQFYIVNSKAKSVRTDLAYELLSQRAHDPEVMESLIERGRDWQVFATNVVKRHHVDRG